MNKYMIGAAAAALFLLSGCSADEVSNSSDEFTLDQLSNVEIKLSARNGSISSANATRAAIIGDTDADIDSLGVFGLARAIQGINQSANAITWFAESENWSGCILNNVAANKVGHDINWAEEGAAYFYPPTQFYSYDFYGYYPYVENEDLVYDATSVKANYEIDGTQDLIWGRATSDADYAYSAKYYRVNQDPADPSMALQHLLTRLVFTVVPGESVDGNGDYEMAALMSVDTLQIIDTYTHLTVNIADLNNIDLAPVDRVTLTDENTDTLTLCDVDAQGKNVPLQPLQVVAPEPGVEPVPQQLGESIMLFPSDKYTIRIVLTMAAHDEQQAQRFVSEVPLQLVAAGERFAQGTSYTVKITVHGPQAVSLKAQLTPWDVEDGPELEL